MFEVFFIKKVNIQTVIKLNRSEKNDIISNVFSYGSDII